MRISAGCARDFHYRQASIAGTNEAVTNRSNRAGGAREAVNNRSNII